MSCALQEIICQRLDSQEYRQLREELLKRCREDPQYFVYLKPSLAVSLPREWGFNERIVRMTCDRCALNPLEECDLMEVLLLALQQRLADEPGKPGGGALRDP